jgi:hypothetical protein
MDAQDQRGPVADRCGVIRRARPVRCPDLAEDRSGLRHDIGHAEGAADFHEFAA